MSFGELIVKLWYIYTMEYDSEIKIYELLTHTTTWIDLKGITLNEKSQSQKIFFQLDIYLSEKNTDFLLAFS